MKLLEVIKLRNWLRGAGRRLKADTVCLLRRNRWRLTEWS
ncbi:hypothetical protein C5S32_03830 [ANME-1 cluster archaeon GoMg1]|nr:hypothetical protein [ANME-1 cluster archaeon GoMg1]